MQEKKLEGGVPDDDDSSSHDQNLLISTVSSDHDAGSIHISLDIVAAARRHLSFLRTINNSPWLRHPPNLSQAIRRYDELWMPLISDLCDEGSSEAPMVLPPIDVQWVWHCHCLNPVKYREYCTSRFSKVIEKPAIFDDENEDYAMSRCWEIWCLRYPSEPFDLEPISDIAGRTLRRTSEEDDDDLYQTVSKHGTSLMCSRFSEPYLSETVYLIAAKKRYRGFLYMLQRFREDDGHSRCLVPTSDILLMWLTHQSFPRKYEGDMKGIEGDLERVVGVLDAIGEEEVQMTRRLWERAFGQPFERAGATLDGISGTRKLPVINWDVSDADVNRKYKEMEPRFLLEVCVFMKGKIRSEEEIDIKNTFLRLRTVRCHRELKMDRAISGISLESWWRTWHLYCEFGTRGIMLEVRRRGGCLGKSKLQKELVFLWNDLLRAEYLTLVRDVGWQVRALASITPPVQAPYMLKCVPDRVTDDTGAMISDVILRMNQYRPQEGRWLSRTVLNHAGRECFVIRIRMGGGFWRRGGESPEAVKWEERIIEIREGSWSYVAGSIGTAPEKVVGTATPNEENPRDMKATWSLSTGDVLTIKWEGGLSFQLENENSDDLVRLLKGRQMQYQVKEVFSQSEDGDGGEEGFVTLVRSTPENPNGKATALLNWKLFAVEFSPEEDAVLILLLCMAIIRSVSETWREDVGRLLVRRREKEPKLGRRDWGSVLIPSCSDCPSSHLQPWYWNAKEVLSLPAADYSRLQPNINYSPADGGDGLYKRGIIP